MSTEEKKYMEYIRKIIRTLYKIIPDKIYIKWIFKRRMGYKPYIGELTLFHHGGWMKLEPPKWDRVFGDWIELPNKK